MRTNSASWLLASLLAGSAWTAHAEPVAWAFTYTGFFSTYTYTHEVFGTTTTEAFLPDAEISGAFSGSDDDGDGILETDELDSFVVGPTQYLACMRAPTPYARCSFGFTYALDRQELSFGGGWFGTDGYYSGWGGTILSGDEATDYSYNDYSETTYTYYWTDRTTLSFRQLPPPVPEPATGAMAAAGLMVLAGLYRRRRH
ncbi:PEP-CTERM sorting domain-containing protein [Massilia consociata]|uniref:PEP-CTERM sorting domain-containing protein n=1 Tax=Massilia consociata TaxID=760117 RepID=A0ABV6FFL9_9BURK